MKVIQDCMCCGDKKRSRPREFSPRAWAVLMHWQEVESSAIGQPICGPCYEDLRELLIERSGEVDAMMAEDQVQKLQFAVNQTLSGLGQDASIAV